MKRTTQALLFAGLLCLSVFAQRAAAQSTPAPGEMKVTKAYSIDRTPPGLRDRLIVEVDNLSQAISENKVNPRDFVLYLDDRPLDGIDALPVATVKGDRPGIGKLQFRLQRTEKSRAAWNALLGSPTSVAKWVKVSVGLPNQPALPSEAEISLRIFHRGWLVAAIILLVLALFFCIWLARRGWLIHDSNPPQPDAGKQKPYSLALTQAAFWFFLVIGSFIFIYLITDEYNTITEQALILIGIGTGTALGAAMIEASKTDTSNQDLSSLRPERARVAALITELTAKAADLNTKVQAAGAAATPEDQTALQETNIALQENQAKLTELDREIADAEGRLSKPVSESFFKDILTDANGITLHRFQIVIWTVVLGALFVYGVYRELAMPEFSGTLLALMGISSGTYLGFKIPERQN
jgi:hypothetical protein